MRVARIDHGEGPHTAIVSAAAVAVLPAGIEVLDLLCAGPRERARIAAQVTHELPLERARFLAPILPTTLRDFCAFEQHVEGVVMAGGNPGARVFEEWYEGPACYFSNPHAISGPEAVISAPPGCRLLDLELEVAAVIGTPGRDLSTAEARDAIVGYTIWNDWSARDLAVRELALPFGFCKAKDFASTLGPWIVTPDELEPYRDGDRLTLETCAAVNGRPLGTDTLANMAWSFEELVAYAARGAWIAPGDVIGSGTSGAGCLIELWGRHQSRTPPPLAEGDEITLTVQGIGTLTNRIGAPAAPLPAPPRAASRWPRRRRLTAVTSG